MKLQGVKVLLTGGTSGIGLHTVEALLLEGAHVIVAARDAGKLAGLSSKYELAGTYVCDLGSPEAVVELGGKLSLEHPDLQVLINNAGTQLDIRFDSEQSTPLTIESELRTNLLAPLLLTRALLPVLKGQPEAAIVNITSGLALAPKTQSAVYCSSKGGLRIFTQGLRNQLQGTGVRVIEVLPPVVDTAMTAGRGRNKLSPATVAGAIIRSIKGRKNEIYVSKTRLLYWLLRISPSIARNIMRRLG
ncbi:SDR family NAD(P)-dependent oxidoreductase [Paenibacillus oenotherae]|uniref:SDR family NAD(P)-dependent oxidoreductase n=1 Tax=Paenibacillus oenotherae TaxID=1435645 RepID=A0ABS7D470_9BACL|nr:SDR family NAD(P)-dependent oxidoreductase [Paenibacillus oenotherae]MBW7474724.1 SDR family NAD(P)-dependent oxidoreductase [Paenibacillus oenotherae]